MNPLSVVLEIAETIELPHQLRHEIACMAVELDEPWQEVLSDALSEYRSLRGHECEHCGQDHEDPSLRPARVN